MSSLMKLIAERPELQREFADLVDEIRGPVPIAGHPGLDEAETQQVLPETWQSADHVPEMLMPSQAEFALARVAQIKAEKTSSSIELLSQFEREYAEELQVLLQDVQAKKDEVANARSLLREAETKLADHRSRGNAKRMSLHAENRQVKNSAELLGSELARAILSARKKYEKELAIVQAANRAESDKARWDRMAIESLLRRSNAKQVAVEARRDVVHTDVDDEVGVDHADDQPQAQGISFPPMDDHPLLSDSGQPPDGDKPASERRERVPWEELAAECLVQPQNYGDWMSNYASGWGNGKRIEFARKRVLARRVGVEIPDWPEEIIPGMYLGRSPLPSDLTRFYTEVPEDRIMRSARVVPLIDDKESAGQESSGTPAAEDPGIP